MSSIDYTLIELVVDEHPDVIEDFIQTMLNGPMF